MLQIKGFFVFLWKLKPSNEVIVLQREGGVEET